MPVEAKADDNVPFLAGRARYQVLGTNPTWVYHEMAAGQTMAGEAPRSATKTEAEIDPTVGGGKARWADLTKGGLFTLLAHYKRAMVVEAVDNPGSATLAIVDSTGANPRTPPAAPFRVGPGECLKVTGGGAAGKIGFLVRLDVTKVI